jgi:hypothetical protein
MIDTPIPVYHRSSTSNSDIVHLHGTWLQDAARTENGRRCHHRYVDSPPHAYHQNKSDLQQRRAILEKSTSRKRNAPRPSQG